MGQSLVAAFTETKDGQHVSPLLPPQRVRFVQRRELTARGERDRWNTHGSFQHIHVWCLQMSHLHQDITEFITAILAVSSAAAFCVLLSYISWYTVIYPKFTFYITKVIILKAPTSPHELPRGKERHDSDKLWMLFMNSASPKWNLHLHILKWWFCIWGNAWPLLC